MYLKTISDRDQQPVCLEFLFKILRVMFFPSNMLNWYFVINELSLPLYFHHSSVHYSALGPWLDVPSAQVLWLDAQGLRCA